MTKEQEIEHTLSPVSLFLLVFFVWMFFFMRGCGSSASYYDEYLKAAHGHVVDGVDYDDTEGY